MIGPSHIVHIRAVSGESSLELLARARAGDSQALEDLIARYLPRLRRWASGRLPASARERDDTDDLVQETVIKTLRKLEGFDPRHAGALQGYLRQAVLNRIRDAIRRQQRRPAPAPLDDDMTGDGTSPLEQAIGVEALERYDAALATLAVQDQEAIIGRIEWGYDYEELARELGKPSSEAARVAVRRALLKLADRMRHGGS
jgi:RNA polymerase sigma-70 factor (ECF subfamily)